MEREHHFHSRALRDTRQGLRLTQEDVARAAGITTRQYQRIETGEADPLLSTASAIADALETTIDSLLW